ncbi:hypothetical protein, partial [Prevotella sp. HMSC073D09]|uniref:hypothetical protein n=1 Tax=Prevotella sp. HMSC073D09 TaxID=1739459 RepID=UPI001439700D
MKCRVCMMGVPLAVALVALAWAVSVPVRGAKAMFAATNNVCAYNASDFSDPKGDGLQCADGALAVVSTSHALSSPIIYKECQGQDAAIFRTDGESFVATSSATPII